MLEQELGTARPRQADCERSRVEPAIARAKACVDDVRTEVGEPAARFFPSDHFYIRQPPGALVFD